MRADLKRTVLAVALASACGIANAAPLITWSGGTNPYTDVGNNFGSWFGGSSTSVPILEQGTISLTDIGKVTVEYYGKEAGFNNNQFWWGSLGPYSNGTFVATTGPGTTNPVPDPIPASPGAPLVTYNVPGIVSSGVLPFYFGLTDLSAGGTIPRAVPNGHVDTSGRSDDIGFWFGAAVNGLLPTSGTSVWVLLDDSGGNQDNDHDDMVMRITVEAVPEPSTWMMMIGGLGLLGLMARRRTFVS